MLGRAASGVPLLARAVGVVATADRRGLVVCAALQVVGALSGLAVVLASKEALEAVLSERSAGDAALVLPLLLLAAATTLAGSVGVVQAQQQRLLAERTSQHVWGRLLRAAAGVDLITYESPAFLRRLDRVRGSAVGRPLTVVTSLLGLAGSGIGIVAMSAALVLIQPLLVPLLLLAGLPAVLVSRRASRAEFAFAAAATPVNQHRGYLKLLLSHRFSAAELRAFDVAPALLARHDADDAAYLQHLRGHVRRRTRYAMVTVVASGVALAGALLAIVALVRADSITVPDAGAAAIAARLLSGQLSTAFRTLGSMGESAPFLRDLERFHADHPVRDRTGEAHELQTALVVEGVSFTYPGAQRPALDDVTVRIPRGGVVALVGENGSGKTTLSKVVSGLYAPSGGNVWWDGDALHRQDLRASTTVLFQDFLRYQMSVADNVVVSETSNAADAQAVERVLQRVGLSEAVAGLPRGIETFLGLELEDGADLSGGQWQRVALARALHRDAPLVVLDEPSSALDPRAEHELFTDVRTVLDGRSALIVSHRYSSVRLADYIYVMDGGRVVEEGTHDQLVEQGGRYAELYQMQAESYLT